MGKKHEPTGEHVGSRHLDPKHKAGDWWPNRDDDAVEHQGGWPGGKRPPLRDNLDK
jgi:hypothetical protein